VPGNKPKLILEPAENDLVFSSEDKPERVSNPGKQALAGLSDIVTGIPAILGLAGAGIQGGYNTLTGDKSFKENFADAASSGIDSSLLSTGIDWREGVNKALEIEEPISTEDQAARLLASLIPVPGLQTVAGAGKLANTARNTFNLLTPAVKYGKGVGTRIAAQTGLGVGIDQGMRALIDDKSMPLMLSEQALSGTSALTPALEGGSGPDLVLDPIEQPDLVLDPVGLEDTPDGFELRRKLDEQMIKRDEFEDTKFWILMAGGALAASVSAKWAMKRGMIPSPTYDKMKKMGEYVHEQQVDKGQALGSGLEEMGAGKDIADKVISNSHADVVDMAANFIETGALGQDFVPRNGFKAHAIDDLGYRYEGLGDNRALFDDAMEAKTILAGRRGGLAPSLWNKSMPSEKLQDTVDAAMANPEVKQLMKDSDETLAVLLDYRRHRGVISDDEVLQFQSKFPGVKEGDVDYLPLYQKSEEEFWRTLSRKLLGIHTTQGKKASIIAEFGPRSGDAGGNNLKAIDSMRRYAVSTIADTNEQSFKSHALANLAGIQHNGKYKPHARFAFDPVTGKKHVLSKAHRPYTARDTTYIGKGTDLSDPDSIHITTVVDDPFVEKTFKSSSLSDLKIKYGDEIVTAIEDGEIHVYHVPDSGLRAALDINPAIGKLERFNSHWKSLFTKGTTGEYSLFAPFSHAFSAQQIASNTAAREGLWAGTKSIGQSLDGTRKLLIANGSNEVANYLARGLATNTGIGKLMPEAAARLQKSFKRRFEDTMLTKFRSETGRTVTGLGNTSVNTTVDDVLEAYGKSFADFYGAKEMGAVWKMWKVWNNAWHEGPAYGAMLKSLGKAVDEGLDINSPQVIRDAVDHSKSLAGDMQRVGASGFSRQFNAAVPFSSAMIQSWNSLGSAARANPIKFIAGATAIIGMPTITEMAYTASLDSASEPWPDQHNPNKMWSYNDYYWNGFTTQQRSDNFIFMIPGKPPWEAVMIPVSPEWGLFRGVVMEAADAIFDYSQVGDIALADNGQGKINREMLWGSVARVADLPIPPLAAATASALGMDVRLGLAQEIKDDPDDPGKVTSILRTHPIGKGERVTRRSGQSKFALGSLDTDTTAILQDIFGAAGALYVKVHEAYNAGKEVKGGSTEQGAMNAVDAFGSGLKSQMRILQPIWGKSVHPNVSDEIAQNLFARRASLKRLGTDFNNYMSNGLLHVDGTPVVGNTIIPPDDPLNMELAADAKTLDANIGLLDSRISQLKRDISTMGNATNLGKATEKTNQIDSKVLEIQSLKAQQLASVMAYEQHISSVLSERYKRNIEIDLSTFTPRENLSTGSISQALRK